MKKYSREHILDIRSAREIGLDRAEEQYSYHIDSIFERENSMVLSVTRSLEHIFRDSQGYAELRSILALQAPNIIKELGNFISCWINLDYCKKLDWNPVYSENSVLYRMVSENDFLPYYVGLGKTESYLSSQKRIRNEIVNYIYGKWLAFVKRVPFPNSYTGNKNALSLQWTSNKFFSLSQLTDKYPNSSRELPSSPSFVEEYAEFAAIHVLNVIQSGGIELTPQARGYITGLFSILFDKSWKDSQYPFDRLIKFKNSSFLSGTGGNYIDRLISSEFKKRDQSVIRFSHGGDKGVFDDWVWDMTDIPFCDVLVGHGRLEALRMEEKHNTKLLPSVTMESPKFVAIGSKHHRDLFLKSKRKFNKTSNVRTVMLCPIAFQGDNRLLPYFKLSDVAHLDVYRYTVKMLKILGYRVVVKRHPKGILAGTYLFDDICDKEIIGGMFPDVLHEADAFVFDVGASAFIEALCTTKPVVLLDIPNQRPINANSSELLRSCCQIVEIKLDEKNRIQLLEQHLRAAIENDVDVDSRESFIKGYLIQPTPSKINSDPVTQFLKQTK